MKFSALRRADRIAGAALAILMQAGFLALLVFSRSSIQPPERPARELTWLLPPLAAPQALPIPTTIDARGAPRRALTQAPAAPPSISPPTTAPAAAPDLRNLGQSIFGCPPETWSSLTPEQRARCPRPGEGFAIQEAPDLLHPPPSQANDGEHWAAELASRKSIRVPCTTIENRALHAGTGGMAAAIAESDQGLMVNPDCAVQELQELRKKLR